MVPSKTLPGQRDPNLTPGSIIPRPSTAKAAATTTTPATKIASPPVAVKSGCEHTKALFERDQNRILRAYEMAVRVSLHQSLSAATITTTTSSSHGGSDKHEKESKKMKRGGGSSASKTLPGARINKEYKKHTHKVTAPKFQFKCENCTIQSESTCLICLECSYTGCALHFKQLHTPNTNHCLGVDVGALGCEGLLYCASCSGYIYDEAFERVRLQKLRQILGLGVVDGLPSGAIRRYHNHNNDTYHSMANQIVHNKATIPTFPATSALRGFYNMGATCFMSVIFQSLLHNPLVRNFYLGGGHERGVNCGDASLNHPGGLGIRRQNNDADGNGFTPTPEITMTSPSTNCLACALDDVFAEFFTSSSVAGYGPTNLLTTSWRVKRSLAGYSEQDAHEFLQMVLNELHASHYDSQVLAGGTLKSLHKISGNDNGTGSYLSVLPDGLRQKEEVNIQKCGCISHRTFCGELESQITCQTCGTVSSTVCDPMMDLSLEIGGSGSGGHAPVAGKTVPKSAFNNAKTRITLEQCLDRFTAGETLDATFKCQTCNMKRLIQKRLSIRRLPSVLSIQLKVRVFPFSPVRPWRKKFPTG